MKMKFSYPVGMFKHLMSDSKGIQILDLRLDTREFITVIFCNQ